MAPVLRILCIGALVNCIHMLGGAVIEAVGMIRYEVYTQAVYAAAVFCGCLFGARYGTEGVAYGVLGASFVFYAMKAYTLNAAIGLPVRSYVRTAIPSLAAGVIMYVAVYVVLNGAGSVSAPGFAHEPLGTPVG
jgi:O-antigen/teichoic acid export membrane protein